MSLSRRPTPAFWRADVDDTAAPVPLCGAFPRPAPVVNFDAVSGTGMQLGLGFRKSSPVAGSRGYLSGHPVAPRIPAGECAPWALVTV